MDHLGTALPSSLVHSCFLRETGTIILIKMKFFCVVVIDECIQSTDDVEYSYIKNLSCQLEVYSRKVDRISRKIIYLCFRRSFQCAEIDITPICEIWTVMYSVVVVTQ